MTPTTYVNFEVYDYRGVETLSSYALNETPLTFIPKTFGACGESITNKVLWNFGDGTASNTLTAVKSYSFPGEYTVNLVIYDRFDNLLFSTQSQIVKIYDYLPYTFIVGQNGFYYQPDESGFYQSPFLDMYTFSETMSVEVFNGKVNGPLKVTALCPIYQEASDIYVDFEGSVSQDYFDIENKKYSHLYKTFSIQDEIYNRTLSAIQYQEIYKITPDYKRIYAKIEDNTIKVCLSSDQGAFFVGLSGTKDFYIKDDTENDLLNLNFYYDKNNSYTPEKSKYLNNTSITLSCEVSPNVPSYLSITSNGLDGEGTMINSFNIPNISYNDISIPFVVKIKDSENFTIKNFPVLELNDIQFSILSSGNNISNYYYEISSLNHTLSGENFGSFRGYLKFKNLSSSAIVENVEVLAIANTISNQLTSYSLTGYSNTFGIYPENYYDFYKHGEDYDLTEIFKNLRFQEFLLDDSVLFDDFIGSTFGNFDSNYENIGKKFYEKITNFVDNHSDVDRNEIFSLLSNMQMLDMEQNTYNSSFLRYPEQIRRIMNMASLSRRKIVGESNKFSENFVRNGSNLGDIIDTITYTISAGVDIVAFEKFSGEYTRLNTMQPVSAVGAFNYQLSAYSDNWGWPLVLPSPFTYKDFDKYYSFYKYLSGYEDTIYGSNIDFANTSTTISLTSSSSDLFDSGIFENMLVDKFMHTLYLED
jgi:hypothetical protein